MALTDEQKSFARYYLGYPDVNRQSFHDLEGALVALSAAGETRVGTVLTSLQSLDTKLTASWDRQKVSKAEEVTLAGPAEIQALRQEGKRLVTTLAAILDVQPRRDVFGSGPTSGIMQRG